MKRITSFLSILFILTAASSVEQAGTLDSSFSNDGKVTTSVGGLSEAYSAAIQANGKIIVAGAGISSHSFVLARYTKTGKLDTSFGSGGIVITDFNTGYFAYAYSVKIQSDGKIVASGFVVISDTTEGFALARYNSNGSLDNSFGINGKVITPFHYVSDNGNSIVIQTDGKIVVASNANNNFALVRYQSNGSLDTSFGINGKVITDFNNGTDNAYSVAIQTDGKIVAGGSSSKQSASFFALARYLSNGSLDSSFGINGKVVTKTSHDNGKSVAIQHDGKILLVGGSQYDGSLIRYTSDGSLDSSFGTNGKVTTKLNLNSVALQANGKIIVGGSGSDGSTCTYTFALAGYNSNGTLDKAFGNKEKYLQTLGAVKMK